MLVLRPYVACVILLGVCVNVQAQDRFYLTLPPCLRPSPLVDAVVSRDLNTLRRLLASGRAVDELHCESETALIVASREGQNEMVRTLLDAGADVNNSNSTGWTALMWAAQKGRIETLRLLLAEGADVNRKNRAGETALMWGARDGNLASVEVLLVAGADTRPTNTLGRDAFLLAAEGGQPETINMFLARGADVNAVDKNETTALMMATPTPAAVKVLLAAGAAVDGRNTPFRMTALYVAAQNGYVETVKLLIGAGADVNASDSYGRSPLNQVNLALSIAVASPELERARRETAALLRAAGGTE